MDDIKLYAKNESGLDALIQSVRVVSIDIGMGFGVEKCAVLVMKRGKVVESNGIDLPNKETIRSIHEENGYKYLGVMEADQGSKERILSSVRCEAGEKVSEKDFKKRRREERRSELEEKALHGHFFRQTSEINDPES
eukprot:gene10379-biopygen12962